MNPYDRWLTRPISPRRPKYHSQWFASADPDREYIASVGKYYDELWPDHPFVIKREAEEAKERRQEEISKMSEERQKEIREKEEERERQFEEEFWGNGGRLRDNDRGTCSSSSNSGGGRGGVSSQSMSFQMHGGSGGDGHWVP